MQKHICEKLILSNLTKSLEKGLVLVDDDDDELFLWYG